MRLNCDLAYISVTNHLNSAGKSPLNTSIIKLEKDIWDILLFDVFENRVRVEKKRSTTREEEIKAKKRVLREEVMQRADIKREIRKEGNETLGKHRPKQELDQIGTEEIHGRVDQNTYRAILNLGNVIHTDETLSYIFNGIKQQAHFMYTHIHKQT